MWAHQAQAVELCRDKDEFAFFFEAGTGKTRTCIEVLGDKFAIAKRTMRTLILAPQVVLFNWKKEFDLYSRLPQSQIIVLHGTGAQRLKQLERTPSYQIVICNYETLNIDSVFEALKVFNPEVIIADESHRIKNHKAKRTKRAVELSQSSKCRYILSGTPVLQNSMDIYAQYLFLDKGETFGKNYWFFQKTYFRDVNSDLRRFSPNVTWGKWEPIKSKEPELKEKIHSKALSVKKSECLDLPPYVKQTLEVDMTLEQWRHYKAMKNDLITYINSKAFVAQLAVTKALRLQQIVSGFIMRDGEDGKSDTHLFKDTPREKALSDLLEDITPSNKVIIWACWRANHAIIRKICVSSGIEFRELLGDMSAPDRDKAIEDFRQHPGVRVLIGSQAAGGIGINLVEASHAIYYSRNFSLEADVQSEARNYRGGSEIHQRITRIDLITPGTIDEQISQALSDKLDISENLIMKAALK